MEILDLTSGIPSGLSVGAGAWKMRLYHGVEVGGENHSSCDARVLSLSSDSGGLGGKKRARR